MSKEGVIVEFLTEGALSAIGNTVTIVSGIPVVVDYVTKIMKKDEDSLTPRATDIEELYYLYDMMDSRLENAEGVPDLFTGLVDKISLMGEVFQISHETKTNPVEVSRDLEELLMTGYFRRPEEAAEFGALFREILYLNNINPGVAEGTFDQIISLLGKGGILSEDLESIVGEETFDALNYLAGKQLGKEFGNIISDEDLINAVMYSSFDIIGETENLMTGRYEKENKDLQTTFNNLEPIVDSEIPMVKGSIEEQQWLDFEGIEGLNNNFKTNEWGISQYLVRSMSGFIKYDSDTELYEQALKRSLSDMIQGYVPVYELEDFDARNGTGLDNTNVSEKNSSYSYQKSEEIGYKGIGPSNEYEDLTGTMKTYLGDLNETLVIEKGLNKQISTTSSSSIKNISAFADMINGLDADVHLMGPYLDDEIYTKPFTEGEQSAFGRMPIAMVTPNQGIFSEENIRKIATESFKVLQGDTINENTGKNTGKNVGKIQSGNLLGYDTPKNQNIGSQAFIQKMQNSMIQINMGYKKDLEKTKNEIINKIIAHIDKKDVNIIIKEHMEVNEKIYSGIVADYIVEGLRNEHSKSSNYIQPYMGAVNRT